MISAKHLLRCAVLGTALTALLTISASAAVFGAGAVNASGLRFRAVPDANGEVICTVPDGTGLIVLADAANGWYHVTYEGTQGFVSAPFINVAATAALSLGKGTVTTDGATLNMRDIASIDGAIVLPIDNGTVLTLDGIDSGWYKVTYRDAVGYVSSDFITPVASDVAPAAVEAAAPSAGENIVAIAKKYLGRPYVYGANGPNSFDCSGYTKYVFNEAGYSINRTAASQLQNGTSVTKGELQAGDLVFFRYNTSKVVSHVGMYIGGGEFIHASSSNSGAMVRISPLDSGHYDDVFVGARRVLG